MLLEFSQDYIGRETAMQEYKQGARAEIPFAQASELVKAGIAFEVDERVEVTAYADEKPVFISTKASNRKVKDGTN